MSIPEYSGAIFLGDFSAVERTVLLASLPLEVDGIQLRRVWLSAYPVAADRSAHWVLTLGVLSQSGFSGLTAIALDSGFGETPRVVTFGREVPVPSGSALAVRLTPSGDAEPITGLSIIPEFAVFGSRRR